MPQSLGPMMRFFSEALNYPAVKVLFGILLIGLLWANARTRKTAIQALLAVLIANGLTDAFKALAPQHRPFQELHDVIMWVGRSASHGTASAHSANMAAVAFVFVYHLRWWGSPWILIAIVVGFSRIYCGAHYPHQVLLGWLCGLAAGFSVTQGWHMIQKWRTGRENDKADSQA